jgi:hypothetical protein
VEVGLHLSIYLLWISDASLSIRRIDDVVAVGKAHGATREDLYGSLYFYLTEQLQSFSDRIKKFRVSFRVFDRDARELAKDIHSGATAPYGVARSTCFDRIDVSNIIDPEYIGIRDVLVDWAPFLNKANQHATILGYSMNWVPKQLDARPREHDYRRLTAQLIKMGKVGRQLAAALL